MPSILDHLEKLHQRIDQIDWNLAKADIAMFIADKQNLNIWSASFFHDILDHLKVIES